jgi:tetratricopeptide (TPR) repeat protein
MIERHYDDESLIALIEDTRSDVHLQQCAECSDRHESYRGLALALGDGDLWDPRELPAAPVASTIATLRAFATTMATEDDRAVLAVDTLLSAPRDRRATALSQHPEWKTAGVVRKLIERSDVVLETVPLEAAAITEIAIAIAEQLDPGAYPSDSVHHLRGQAWLQHAFNLNYTSRYDEALAATDRAARHFDGCAVDEYDRARLGIVRTIVLEVFDRLDDAAVEAARSASTFLRFEDPQRTASATIAQALILFRGQRFDEAATMLLDLERRVSAVVDADTQSRIAGNIGYAMWRLRRYDEALRWYDLTTKIHHERGNRTEALRIRWNVAVMLTEAGRTNDAYQLLAPLTSEMEDLGLTNEAAVNMLELAEILLARARYAEVEELCAKAIASFSRSGIPHRQRAMTALAYIREAAQLRKATESMARNVRDYIHRLPAEPNLLFAPAPF